MLPWVASPILNISSLEAAETVSENTRAGKLNAFLNKFLLHLDLEREDVGRVFMHVYFHLLGLKPRLESNFAYLQSQYCRLHPLTSHRLTKSPVSVEKDSV